MAHEFKETKMTSINAGGAFYRVQNEMANNSDRLSQNMQRLASGKQNIAPGDRTASTAVAFAMKAESASLKVGMMNGTEALQSIEMVTNDLAQLNDIVVRLEELHALGANAFVTPEDRSALAAEADNLLTEMTRISGDATWKGNSIIKTSATDTTTNTMSFGRNAASIDIVLDAFEIPEVALGFNTVGDSIYGDIDISTDASATGTAYASLTTTPQAVAAQTVVDTYATYSTTRAQSALAVDGAVFYEHLTKAGQDKFNTTGTADSNGISLTATGAAADAAGISALANPPAADGAVTLVGGGPVTNGIARAVIMTQTLHDQSAVKFTIVGTGADGGALTETIDGLDGSDGTTVTTTALFKTISSITNTGGAGAAQDVSFGTVAGNAELTLGGTLVSNGTATNDNGRNVTLTSGSALVGAGTIKFTVTGTDRSGNALTEEITGQAAVVAGIAVAANPPAADAAVALVGGGVVTNDIPNSVMMTQTAHDQSAVKFTIVGTGADGGVLTETIDGIDGSVAGAVLTASTTALFKTISSITNTGGAGAAQNVEFGTQGVATGSQFFKTITSVTSDSVPIGTIEVGVGATIGGPGPVELAGSDIGSGSAEAALALLSLKTVVDNMNISAGTLYNKVSNTMSHMGSLNAGYQLDLASKMDVDFAGETAELAKGQILAQAGTAMLAQANAQRQGMLALLQS